MYTVYRSCKKLIRLIVKNIAKNVYNRKKTAKKRYCCWRFLRKRWATVSLNCRLNSRLVRSAWSLKDEERSFSLRLRSAAMLAWIFPNLARAVRISAWRFMLRCFFGTNNKRNKLHWLRIDDCWMINGKKPTSSMTGLLDDWVNWILVKVMN